MSGLSVYDHVRPIDTDCPDGIYRVVGASDGAVTLLRVTDADGRRVATGDVVTVHGDERARFDAAANPDGNRPLAAVVASRLEAASWSLRVFGRHLATRPLPSAAALALVLAGAFGDRALSLPDAVFGGLVLAGSLGLAYVGSGRLP